MLWVIGSATLGGALLLVAPLALRTRPWQVLFPRLAMALWWGSVLLGCASVVAAVAMCAGMSVAEPAPASGWGVVALTSVPWLVLGAVGFAIGLASGKAPPPLSGDEDAVRTTGSAVVSREDRGSFTLVRVASADPFAYAVPGPAPEILISAALEGALSQAQLRAVVAHEYAHLRHHHNWFIRSAQINAACIPRILPAGPRLQEATTLLVELVADDIAAKQAGAAHLANALHRLSRLTGDASLDLRAERMTLRTWPMGARRRLPAPVRI